MIRRSRFQIPYLPNWRGKHYRLSTALSMQSLPVAGQRIGKPWMKVKWRGSRLKDPKSCKGILQQMLQIHYKNQKIPRWISREWQGYAILQVDLFSNRLTNRNTIKKHIIWGFPSDLPKLKKNPEDQVVHSCVDRWSSQAGWHQVARNLHQLNYQSQHANIINRNV